MPALANYASLDPITITTGTTSCCLLIKPIGSRVSIGAEQHDDGSMVILTGGRSGYWIEFATRDKALIL
jgi:hypothetical protein